jgi:glycosyltransferase involved in cell wall biosynthesis
VKILQLVHYAPLGGVESHTRNIFVALEARGHQNVLVYDGSALPGLEREGRRVYHLPGLLDRDPSRGRQLAKRAEEIMKETRCDLAYVHLTANPILSELILHALPTVYFAHTYATFCSSGARLYRRTDTICQLRGVPNWRCLVNAYLQQCNTRRPPKLWGLYRDRKEFGGWARRADAIVCASEYVRHQHIENGFSPERIHALHSPRPEPHEHRSSSPPGEPLILFLGRITPQKGLGYLIRAMAKIETRCRLVVAGDGYELPRMRALTAKLQLDDRVSFLGAVEYAAVGDLYAKATVLAVPSVWPEPFGLVGPEAMSYGVPVVAFRVGGIPEWLRDGETGFLVEPKDVVGLAQRIELLLNDPALAQRLGSQGRIAVEHLSPDRHVDGLLRLSQEAVDRRLATATTRGRRNG